MAKRSHGQVPVSRGSDLADFSSKTKLRANLSEEKCLLLREVEPNAPASVPTLFLTLFTTMCQVAAALLLVDQLLDQISMNNEEGHLKRDHPSNKRLPLAWCMHGVAGCCAVLQRGRPFSPQHTHIACQ